MLMFSLDFEWRLFVRVLIGNKSLLVEATDKLQDIMWSIDDQVLLSGHKELLFVLLLYCSLF